MWRTRIVIRVPVPGRNALIEGLKEAQAKLEPARLGIGKGASMAKVNRRQFAPDGRCHLGVNPDGAVDRQIGLLRLDRLDGSPIALIANYAMHGTVLGGENCLITADVPLSTLMSPTPQASVE